MTRLIDADLLCEEFKKRQRAALRWKENAILDCDEERQIRADATLAFLCEVKLTIDNAPTVEVFCSYLSDGEVKQPCIEAPCSRERPQGKWKYHKAEDIFLAYMECDQCGLEELFDNENMTPKKFRDYYKFCPNCGADMRGQSNEYKISLFALRPRLQLTRYKIYV